MGVRIIETRGAAALSAGEVSLMQGELERAGRVTLLAPTFAAAGLFREGFARAGAGIGIDALTPAAWIESLWGLLGTGERLVAGQDRRVLMADVMAQNPRLAGPLKANSGTVSALASIARDLAPYLDAAQADELPPDDGAHRAIFSLVGAYRARLAALGMVEPSEAAARLAGMLRASRPACARSVAVRDVECFPSYLVELLSAVARKGEASVLLPAGWEPFGDAVSAAFARCGLEAEMLGLDGAVAPRTPAMPAFIEAAGPHVRAAAYTDEICRLAGLLDEAPSGAPASPGAPRRVLVVSSDPLSAFFDLAPYLAARGVSASAAGSVRFGDTRAGRAVAMLVDLARRMEAARAGEISTAEWWPAPELSDWCLSPLSGMGAFFARALDKELRSHREYTPDRAMSRLQSKDRAARAQSGVPVCAFEVMRLISLGDVPAALGLMLETARAQRPSAFGTVDGLARQRVEVSALERALEYLHRARHVLGVDASCALAGVYEISVPVGVTSSVKDAAASVDIATARDAGVIVSRAAVPVMFVDVDSEAYPLSHEAGPLVEAASFAGRPACAIEPSASLGYRTSRALSGVPAASFGRVSRDGQAKRRYPASVWTERAARLRLERGLDDRDESFVAKYGEGDVSGNFDPCRGRGGALDRVSVAAPQYLGPEARQYLELKRPGESGQMEPVPFSASQLERYANCPLCWFVSSRVRPRSLDAGFTPIDIGNLVHDVLHVFYGERLERGLGRVTHANLPDALMELQDVFGRVRALHARGKTDGSSAVIAHSSVEEAQIDAVLPQLKDVLRYEASAISPFSPALFEYSFNKLGARYAGRPLGGRIDRVDIDAENRALVIDYKHTRARADYALKDPTVPVDGAAPADDPRWLPRHIQTLVYAQVLRRELGLDVRGAIYFATKDSPSMRGALADALVDQKDGAAPVPGVRAGFPGDGGSMDFDALLDRVEQEMSHRLDELEAGIVTAAPAAQPSCSHNHPMGFTRRNS